MSEQKKRRRWLYFVLVGEPSGAGRLRTFVTRADAAAAVTEESAEGTLARWALGRRRAPGRSVDGVLERGDGRNA